MDLGLEKSPSRPSAGGHQEPAARIRAWRPFLIGVAIAAAAYSLYLFRLVTFALESDLYSYILLIPAVSVYMLWGERTSPSGQGPYRAAGGGLIVAGLALLGVYFGRSVGSQTIHAAQDALALTTASFVVVLMGLAALLLDRALFRRALFPLCFLLFIVPFPVAMEHFIESALQHGSAPPAYWFYRLAGTPVFKENLVFQLPGMTLQIAPECSGIRSTLVLFMTSLVAGHLFLRSPWRRAILAAAVIPLALLRNGFRVFVIGELCVHIGPHMIDSVIHHRGGPIFFVLSLIPFSVLVYYLFRSDRKTTPKAHGAAS